MERSPVKSKLVHSIGYDEAKEVLEVQLNAKDGSPGKVYRYHDVGRVCHQEFMQAESPGKFFLTYIKPFYRCERVLDEGKNEAQETADEIKAPAPDGKTAASGE